VDTGVLSHERLSAVGRARLTLLIAVVLTLQVAMIGPITIDGVHPDLMLLLAAVGGATGGPARGALIGFGCGLLSDLFLETPFGLSALTFCIVGYAVGLFQGLVLRSSWWIVALASLLGTAGGEFLYALIGAIVGQPQTLSDELPRIIGIVSLINAVLSVPATRLMSWATESSGAAAARTGRRW